MEELAQKGPLRPEELIGVPKSEFSKDEPAIKAGLAKMPPRIGPREVEDKQNQRTGWLLDEENTKMMLTHITNAKQVIHKDQVTKKIPLTEKAILDAIDTLKGVIMITYPAYHGLGAWEPAKVILENDKILEKDEDMFIEEKAVLWYAGKEMQKSKKLMDYLGKNEKTTVIVKMTNGEGAAPPREPVIDQETHKQMLAYYYKKQEEAKKAEADIDDGYLTSPWADPKGLKGELHGVGDIKWKK